MKLKDARVNAGMTIKKLADTVGVSPAAICRYENGQRLPRLSIMKRLEKCLGVTIGDIVDSVAESNGKDA